MFEGFRLELSQNLRFVSVGFYDTLSVLLFISSLFDTYALDIIFFLFFHRMYPVALRYASYCNCHELVDVM